MGRASTEIKRSVRRPRRHRQMGWELGRSHGRDHWVWRYCYGGTRTDYAWGPQSLQGFLGANRTVNISASSDDGESELAEGETENDELFLAWVTG